MMKTNPWLILLLVGLVVAMQIPTLPRALAAEPALLFDDEFDGPALDTHKWVPTYWWGSNGCTIATNGELEWYLPDEVSVSNGTLKLQASKRTVTGGDGKTYNYTSGVVTTGKACWQDAAPDKFTFQYGYVEMRAKAPKGRGLWPAFWLLSGDQDWPPEIDVLEILGHQPNIAYMTVHFEDAEGVHRSSGGQWTGPDFSAGWHTFGVDWQPTAIVWYVDGVERRRYTIRDHIPAEPMYLLLNLAVGGTWPGAPDASTVFPASYEVDYVRVWSSRPPMETRN
jgi:beta-glucanase (GH16 family)